MKPRVLYLCGQSPWLCNGGALLRNYWMIRALSRRFTVDLVTSEEPPGGIPADFAALIDRYACFPRDKRVRSGFGRALAAADPRESALTAGWTNAALREYVADRLGRHAYVAIQTDLRMHAALPRRDAIPIVYNAHSCETLPLARRATKEPLQRALILSVDSVRVKRIERALFARATLVAACAEDDVRDFEGLSPAIRSKVAIIPNGVDVERYDAIADAQPESRTVLVTGSMDRRPNLLGLRWFLHEVVPQLQAENRAITVRIAGRMEPSLVRELADYPGVEAIPNPLSMDEHLARATVVAAPILASSGRRLRILEAWASSRPVVTTAAGAFGLDFEDGRDLLARDSAADFVRAITRVLDEPALARRLALNARTRVVQYDWRSIGDTLIAAYERTIVPPQHPVVPSVSEDLRIASMS